MRLLVRLALLLCLGQMFYASAAIDVYSFPDEDQRDRYHVLIDELRCPQCLNTNLAGSDAMIARDLRREVHRMILEGMTDDEILDYMYQRYGDFILYEPRLKPGTLVLWFGPFVLLLICLFVVYRLLRRRTPPRVLDADEEARLKSLVDKHL